MVEPKPINLADIVEDEEYIENDPSTWADNERLPDDDRIISDFNNRVATQQTNKKTNKPQSGGKTKKTKKYRRTRKTKKRKQTKKNKKRRRIKKSKKNRKK